MYRVDTSHVRRREKPKAKGSGKKCVVHPEHDGVAKDCGCVEDNERTLYDESLYEDDDSKTMLDHGSASSGEELMETGSSCSSFDYQGGSPLTRDKFQGLALTREKFQGPALTRDKFQGPFTRGDVHLDLTKIHATGEEEFRSPFGKQTIVTRSRFSEPILKSTRSRLSSLLFGAANSTSRLAGSCDGENCNSKRCDEENCAFKKSDNTVYASELVREHLGDFNGNNREGNLSDSSGDAFKNHSSNLSIEETVDHSSYVGNFDNCQTKLSKNDTTHSQMNSKNPSPESIRSHHSSLPQRSDSPLFVSSVNLEISSPATSSSGSFIIDKSCDEHRVCHQCTPLTYEVQVPYYKIEYRQSGEGSSEEDELRISNCDGCENGIPSRNYEEETTPGTPDVSQEEISSRNVKCERCDKRISSGDEFERRSTLCDQCDENVDKPSDESQQCEESSCTFVDCELRISSYHTCKEQTPRCNDSEGKVSTFNVENNDGLSTGETVHPICECCENLISSCNGHKYLSPCNSCDEKFVVFDNCNEIIDKIAVEEITNPSCESCENARISTHSRTPEDELSPREEKRNSSSRQFDGRRLTKLNIKPSCDLEPDCDILNCNCCDQEFSNDLITGCEIHSFPIRRDVDDSEFSTCESCDIISGDFDSQRSTSNPGHNVESDVCRTESTSPQPQEPLPNKHCDGELRSSQYEENLPIPLSMYENYDSLLCYRSSDIEGSFDLKESSITQCEECPSCIEPFDGGTSKSAIDVSSFDSCDGTSNEDPVTLSHDTKHSGPDMHDVEKSPSPTISSISLCDIPDIRPVGPFRDSIPMSPQCLRRPPSPFCDRNSASSLDDRYSTSFPFDAKPPSPFCDGHSPSPTEELNSTSTLFEKPPSPFCDRNSASPVLDPDRVTCHYDMRPVTPRSPIRPASPSYDETIHGPPESLGHSISICDIEYTNAPSEFGNPFDCRDGIGQAEHQTDAHDYQNEEFSVENRLLDNPLEHFEENVADELKTSLGDNENPVSLDIRTSYRELSNRGLNCNESPHDKEHFDCEPIDSDLFDAEMCQDTRFSLEKVEFRTKPAASGVHEFDASMPHSREEFDVEDSFDENNFNSRISFGREHYVAKSCDPVAPFSRSFDSGPFEKETCDNELPLEDDHFHSPGIPYSDQYSAAFDDNGNPLPSPLHSLAKLHSPCKHNVQHRFGYQFYTCSVRSSDSGLADIASPDNPATLSSCACTSSSCTPHTSASSMHLTVTSQARTYRSEMYIHWWLKTKIPIASLTTDDTSPGRDSGKSVCLFLCFWVMYPCLIRVLELVPCCCVCTHVFILKSSSVDF